MDDAGRISFDGEGEVRRNVNYGCRTYSVMIECMWRARPRARDPTPDVPSCRLWAETPGTSRCDRMGDPSPVRRRDLGLTYAHPIRRPGTVLQMCIDPSSWLASRTILPVAACFFSFILRKFRTSYLPPSLPASLLPAGRPGCCSRAACVGHGGHGACRRERVRCQ